MAAQFRIGILSYNHPELTQRVIRSCLEFVEPERITLLHNGSENRWVQQLQALFPRLEHVILTENQGYSGGANALLERVLQQTEWCLFLTNDVQLLSLQVPTNPGLIAPLIYRRNLQKIDSVGGYFYPHRGELAHCRHEDDFVKVSENGFPYIPGTAYWIHQTILKDVGYFDTALGTYWEDVDYSQRVRLKGFPLGYQKETQLLHSIGKTCHKKRFYTSYLYIRNKYYVSLRYNPKSLSRILFRFRYWTWWSLNLMKDFFKKDLEGVRFKIQIFRDLILLKKIQKPKLIQLRKTP